MPFAVRIDREQKEDFDMVDSGWGPDFLDPITFSDLWVTDGLNNNQNYANPEYDSLIEQAQQTTDAAEKWSLLQKAEKILLEEDAGLAPVYQQAYNILVSEKVEGFTYHSVGSEFSYKYITITE